MERNKVIIIGGGLGGMFAGAILAKEGWQVEILEKNRAIGGGLQSFGRWGVSFDTGMHMLVGLEPGGNLRKLCAYLGILDSIGLRKVDDDCADEVHCPATGQTFRIAQGREGFVASLAWEFPHEAEGIRRYVDKLYEIADSIDLFRMRPYAYDSLQHLAPDALMPVDRLINMYVKDSGLRRLLTLRAPLYDGRAGETPAYVHALISTLYIDGARRFVGPSQQLADALAQVIIDHGGRVLAGAEVTDAIVENKRVQAVVTADGERHVADTYISAIHLDTLMDLVRGRAFSPAYRQRIASIPNSCSAFIVFIKLKPQAMPYINHTVYVNRQGTRALGYGGKDGWPQGVMCMTPPVDGPWAETMVLTALMDWEQVEAWQDSCHSARPEAYRQWKEERMRELIGLAATALPALPEAIDKAEAASPLTIRDYYGAPRGAIYGFRKDCRDIMLSQIAPVTKVSNLYLTGQCVNLHGICGVPLTAIVTAELLLGRNYIINKINQLTDNG